MLDDDSTKPSAVYALNIPEARVFGVSCQFMDAAEIQPTEVRAEIALYLSVFCADGIIDATNVADVFRRAVEAGRIEMAGQEQEDGTLAYGVRVVRDDGSYIDLGGIVL